MRKLLLSASAVFTTVAVMAQGAVPAPKVYSKVNYLKIEEYGAHSAPRTVAPAPAASRGGSRSVSSTPLGTSGNPYTIINNNVNQVDVEPSTNQVIFIHRTAKQIFTSDDANNGQYRYDVSRDGGSSWSINLGLLNPSGTQAGFACRFPNATLFNPSGNTNPDSSYLVYSGSFHDGSASSSWNGYCVGRARLDNSASTFKEGRYTPNSSNTNIMTSFCKGAPGVFWGIDILTVDGTDADGISVYKGTWSTDSNAVHWVAQPTIVPPFDLSADGKGHITSYSIGFDPTGQHGWIACAGDVHDASEATIDPFFYKSDDFGASWTGPIILDLDSINGVFYDPVNGPASLSFDCNLAVDINGNPHYCVVVLPGSTTTAYSIIGNAPDKYIYDITYDGSFAPSCQWRAIRLDYVNSLRKTVATNLIMDNHIRTSRNADGSKVFFGWTDSDSTFVGVNLDNDQPDYKMVGLDMVNQKRTAVKNFTTGDAAWGGQVLWPSASPLATYSGSTYNIPTVFARMNAALSDVDTTYFHYISNINFTDAEFSTNLDNDAPDISIVGDSVIWVAVGGSYSDAGATAFDCYDGVLTDSIVVTNPVNTSAAGTYIVSYQVCDAAGNCATVTRTVRVASPPICDFTIQHVSGGKYRFIYSNPSALATSWDWNYGDGSGKVNALSLENKTYTTNGSWTVRLTARNPIGSCFKDTVLNVFQVGIEDIDVTSNVTLFPNPANSITNLMIDLPGIKEVNISIVNIIGEKVYSNKISDNNGPQNVKLDVSEFAPGAYIVRIDTEKGSAIKKLYISRK